MRIIYVFILSSISSPVLADVVPLIAKENPVLYPFIQLYLPLLVPAIPAIAFFWAIYIFQASQERLRREKAIEIVRIFISAFSVEVRAALKIAEKLDRDQIKLINSGSSFEIETYMKIYLNISVPGVNFLLNGQRSKFVVDDASSFKLRAMILNFLNAAEIVCSAWVYDVCNSEIIVAEINFLYDEAEELSILEKFRTVTHSNVHYPNIVEFIDFLKSIKKNKRNPVKRFRFIMSK